MDNQQERLALEIGWLIGIIEGEGCFYLTEKHERANKSFSCGLQITNTNLEIIEKAKSIFSKLEVPFYVNSYPLKSKKIAYNVKIVGVKRLKRFFDVLFDYFECRRDQAGLLKEFVELRLSKSEREAYSSEEHSIARLLSQLNKG